MGVSPLCGDYPRISVCESRVQTLKLILFFFQLLEFFLEEIMHFLGYYYSGSHRKLTAACQTKAKRKKSTGMTGITSTIGFKKA